MSFVHRVEADGVNVFYHEARARRGAGRAFASRLSDLFLSV
jgi:hypothetical protein